MRHLKSGLGVSLLTLILCGCGGGGGSGSSSSSSSSSGGANTSPTANAGPAQAVTSGVTVTLNGSLSNDPDGSIASYAWTQTLGAAVSLSNASSSRPSFTAPTVAAATTLTFALVVTDNRGAASTSSTVNITVNPPAGNVAFTGRVRFARVNFNTTSPRGLNYGNPVLQPARGVLVRALTAGTQTERASTVTDGNGSFAMSLPANINIDIEVVARLQATGAASWDVRVQNGATGNDPFRHTHGTPFNSSVGSSQNIDIPTGITAAGTASGARPSGPFAILDTIYTAIQGVLSVAPDIDFPPLIVDWGSQAAGTFFTSGPNQRIALLSRLNEDTDEFDQHVVAHEFGHYIEHNFSRADNIGGAHGLGDRLDARVAFGEGFGYAFAAMMLNDPIARDSFFGDITPDDGINNPVSASGGFNIEANPPTNPPSSGIEREGCWCSESSVWSILYDLYDSTNEGNDNLSLGFQPVWNVLIDEQRTTPAFTTIFSFITALKAAQPGAASAIDTLVAAQNIDAVNIDAFGGNETHYPHSPTLVVAQNAALPVYSTATLGTPLTLRNVDDAGRHNKIGNRRYVRFNVPTSRTVNITLATSNTADNDPDFVLWRAGGGFAGSGQDPPPGPETQSFSLTAGNYLLDVYDCANGCSTEQGASGDYTLTLTIN